jgi:DNA-binding response OmpR family regulator
MRPALGRVLVVEDRSDWRALVAEGLEQEGFEVAQALDARSALAAVDEDPPDLVLLEVALSDIGGLELLRQLRRSSDLPVILLSAGSQNGECITGLDLGADDYVLEPVSTGELAARMRAVLRRSRPAPAQDGLRFGELLIDRRSREVRVGASRVALTHREFDLLAFLASSPRQVFSREQLLAQVWGSSSDWQDPATVTEHVRRLRVKLENAPEGRLWIRTVRGVGYAFTTEDVVG